MTDAIVMNGFFEYAKTNSFALFPCAAGTKRPILPWKDGSTHDPAQWAAWQVERNNFAIDCAKSGLIVIDIDASKVSRTEAWQAYHNLCLSWGLATPPVPMTQSARGGWHTAFKRPGHLAPTDLRGGGTLVKVSDIRSLAEGEKDGEVIGFKNRGYCVAPGSHLDTDAGPLFYLLMPAAAEPPVAPDALVELIRSVVVERDANVKGAGTHDFNDTKLFYKWMADNGIVTCDDEWREAGMVAKIEFGDDGLDLWETLATNSGGITDDSLNRWNSFSSDPKPGCVRLETLMKRAHALGWKGSVGKSAAVMFDGIALPTASGAVPIMFGRGQAHVRLFSAILAAVPVLERTAEHPELPDIGHPLQDAINAAIPGIMASPAEHVIAHAVLNLLHPVTAAKVWPITPLVLARTAALEAEEKQALAPDAYARDVRTQRIESDNIDNAEFYLNSLGIEYRWNEWFECAEIKGWKWSHWTRITDAIVTELRMHGTKTGTRFVMAKEFAADALLSLSHRNKVDPALTLLDKWQAGWDGTHRLEHWLSRACGVPDNAYYRAVSRTVLLGLVGRIRHPGIKFDLMMVLVSPKQGTEKSSLAKVLALDNEWFIENVSLGLDSKELVLLFAGKTVAEVSEMKNRGDAEAAKAMITTTHDEGRTAYARFTTKRARRNILIGSTNRSEFLDDDTGNRRFLPVHVVGEIDLAWVRATLPFLIGEAAAAACDGEKIELPREVWDLAAEYQEAARAQSDFEVHLHGWFAEMGGSGEGYIHAKDLADLLRDATGRSIAPNRYGNAMRKLGFDQDQKSKVGRVWARGLGPRFEVKRDERTGKTTVKQMFASVGQVVAMAR